ncbi:MAG: hypothetical protein FWC67_03615, partial [Defluviitaleaceae bacterium]|nr:hypothetical protein [Defluviitaleaceae bacterium]
MKIDIKKIIAACLAFVMFLGVAPLPLNMPVFSPLAEVAASPVSMPRGGYTLAPALSGSMGV